MLRKVAYSHKQREILQDALTEIKRVAERFVLAHTLSAVAPDEELESE